MNYVYYEVIFLTKIIYINPHRTLTQHLACNSIYIIKSYFLISKFAWIRSILQLFEVKIESYNNWTASYIERSTNT